MFGGGGKAGVWSEGSLENHGVFCSLRGEKGGDKVWDSAREQEEAETVASSWEEAFFAGGNVIISAQFPGQKILVYLNTSASQSCSSPDTIKSAFSPCDCHFPLAAGG